MNMLNVLSGGAAQGLVKSLKPVFAKLTGFGIEGEFGAVGAMADKLRGGASADMVILTSAIVAKLADEKLLLDLSVVDIGLVETAIAVRTGDPELLVKDGDALGSALLASDAIFVPDIKASTAGIHVAGVLHQLGIADAVADRLKIFPNGATAMQYLARSNAKRPIGCTQATEIISTEGVVLSCALPPGCELSTMYTAGITTRAAAAQQAQNLIGLLTSSEHRQLRHRAGFLNGRT